MTGTAIKRIVLYRIRESQIPIAPLAEQQRIVAQVEELFSDLDAGVAALTRVRANLKRYRATVLKAAVEGRLTADWRATHPNAEPASDLLARVLADRSAKWEADQLAKFAASGKTPPNNWQAKYAEPSCARHRDPPAAPEGLVLGKRGAAVLTCCGLRTQYRTVPSSGLCLRRHDLHLSWQDRTRAA